MILPDAELVSVPARSACRVDHGEIATPNVVVDGKLIHAGGVPGHLKIQVLLA